MSYASENGYTPPSFNAVMAQVMAGVNAEFGTSYTAETFIGTNFYKMYYPMVQRVVEGEIRTSELFLHLQDYIAITNENINRPGTTPPGLIAVFENLGYKIAIKPPIEADAGKIFIAVDVDDASDDYAEMKLELCGLVRDYVVGGVVSMGTEVETLALENGQSFDFKYNLPNVIDVHLKLTITTSENNQFVIKTPEEIKDILLANIAARYRIGRNFEPQRYFSLVDAPWAAAVKLEYSIDAGATWETDIYDADYDDLMVPSLENIDLVEN